MLVAFYIVLSIIVSAITFKNWIDIIPLASAILHTITIIQEKDIAFYAWANLATCLAILVSNIISIVRYDLKSKK